MTSPGLLRRPDDLTTAWLQEVLGTGPVASFSVEPVGTGQMSESYRVTLAYAEGAAGAGEGGGDGPASVVLKVAASDPTSRATGVDLGAYSREIAFYREVAPRVGGPLAACHGTWFDPEEGWFTLVLEDVAPAVQGDQIAGCSVEQARLAMAELARVHAPVLGDPELSASAWLNQTGLLNQGLLTMLWPGFLERYEDRVAPEHRELVERFLASLDAWADERPGPLGLVHGDFRLDNLLFGEPGSPKPFTVVDWQTVGWGPVMSDAAYFLGGGLAVEDRRAAEEELVRTYYDALVAGGVQDLSWEQCWQGYRRQAFGGILMAVAAPMLVQRTERGDDMFMTMLARHAQHAIDLGSVELLPAPTRPEALVPAGSDEGPHDPGAEELWGESWYFDAVSDDGTLGAWVRLGLYPNLGVAWYSAFVTGPDRATVAVMDFTAPLPVEGMASGAADHVVLEPLQRMQVTFAGTGAAYDDAADILRRAPGTPVPVALDLTWETDGTPYQYRIATRYEIPCRVSGTVTVDGQVLQLDGPGQRDHSWGPRDWWAMDWVWSAGRLEDGTRFHAVDLRLGEGQRLGVGYVQSSDGLLELDAVDAVEEVGDDGLPTSAVLRLSPADLVLDVVPRAFGPLLLEAADGRVSHFPRAMCDVTAADGRRGVAWVEWNLNQKG